MLSVLHRCVSLNHGLKLQVLMRIAKFPIHEEGARALLKVSLGCLIEGLTVIVRLMKVLHERDRTESFEI